MNFKCLEYRIQNYKSPRSSDGQGVIIFEELLRVFPSEEGEFHNLKYDRTEKLDHFICIPKINLSIWNTLAFNTFVIWKKHFWNWNLTEAPQRSNHSAQARSAPTTFTRSGSYLIWKRVQRMMSRSKIQQKGPVNRPRRLSSHSSPLR